MSTTQRPLPTDKSGLYEPYFDGLRNGKIRVQHCADCDSSCWPPQDMCPSCHSTTLEWIDAGDHGTIHTFSVYYRAFHPAFADKLPYAVASVRMEPGVIVFGEYAGDPETISIGTPVRGECFTITPEVALLRWVPDLPEVLPDSLKKNQGE